MGKDEQIMALGFEGLHLQSAQVRNQGLEAAALPFGKDLLVAWCVDACTSRDAVGRLCWQHQGRFTFCPLTALLGEKLETCLFKWTDQAILIRKAVSGGWCVYRDCLWRLKD